MAGKRTKRIGILTGGGDCPGLNAVIRAVVRKALPAGYEVYGFIGGWEGILTRKQMKLSINDVGGILRQGGTILRTSRTNPYVDKKTEAKFKKSLKELKLHALIAVGGEDTLGVAARIAKERYPIIGVPKTIDNDLMGTEMTFGFDTAVSVATDAIDRCHTTAESHNRVIVLEVMGRHAGWIATYSGMAGGADYILIPERPFEVDHVADAIKRRHKRGKSFSIIVVAEGAKFKKKKGRELVLASQEKDAFGHVKLGGIGTVLANEIEALTGFESRAVVLGHIQRGGSPTAFDRILATRYGVKAVELIEKGKFGRLVALKGDKITDVALSIVTSKIRTVNPYIYQVAETFFG
jgi:6-phosphofructokinase 1